MKKGSKIIASVLALSSALGLVGCGDDGGSTKKIVSYKVVGAEEEYDIDSTLDLTNLELEFTWSDNTTTKVKVTQDMLDALPDMTTAGDKEIKITYNGKEYTFSLQVVDKKADMIALLNSFLADYNSETIKSSSLKIDFDALVKYLGQSAEVRENLLNFCVSRVNDLKGYKIYKYENGVYYFEKKFENSADLNHNACATNDGWFRAFGIDYCIRAYCDESTATPGEPFMFTGGNIVWENPTYPSGEIHDVATSMDMKTIMQMFKCTELTLEDFANSLNVNIGKSAILNGTMGDLITLNSDYVGLYKAIINWVVNSVSSISASDIASADTNLSANLGLSVEPIKEMFGSITVEKVYDVVINDLLLTEDDEYYAEMFSQAIMDMFYLQDNGVTLPKLKFEMDKLVKGLRKSMPTIPFIKENLTEINKILQKTELKDAVKNELNVLVDGINANDKNTISKLVKNISKFVEIKPDYITTDYDEACANGNVCWKIDDKFENIDTGEITGTFHYYKIDDPKVEGSDALVQKYFDNMAGIVEAFENATDLSTKELRREFLNGIVDNLRKMDEVIVELDEKQYYGLQEIAITPTIKMLIEFYKGIYSDGDAENGIKSTVEKMIDMLGTIECPEGSKIYRKTGGGFENLYPYYTQIVVAPRAFADVQVGDYLAYYTNTTASEVFVKQVVAIVEKEGKRLLVNSSTIYDLSEFVGKTYEDLATGNYSDLSFVDEELYASLYIGQITDGDFYLGLDSKITNAVSDIAQIIYDAFNVSQGEQIDYATLVEDIANRLGVAKDEYVDAYNNGTLTLLTDAFDNWIGVDNYSGKASEVMSVLRSACSFVDSIILGKVTTSDEILDGVQKHINAIATKYSEYLRALEQEHESMQGSFDTQLEIMSVITKLTNVEKTIDERVKEVVTTYKDTIIDMVSTTLMSAMGLDISNADLVGEMKDVLTPYVDDYLGGKEINYNQLITDVNKFVATFVDGDNKTLFESVTTALMIFGNYGKDTDYNKLLENIELPKEIESVDFNKLINEVLLNKETWKIFKLDNVKVDYVLDDNGKLIKEILTLNLNIDYDLMLTSLDSNLTLKFEINF